MSVKLLSLFSSPCSQVLPDKVIGLSCPCLREVGEEWCLFVPGQAALRLFLNLFFYFCSKFVEPPVCFFALLLVVLFMHSIFRPWLHSSGTWYHLTPKFVWAIMILQQRFRITVNCCVPIVIFFVLALFLQCDNT